MDLLNGSEFGFKGMFSKLAKSGLKLGQVLEVVRIVSIQSTKGTSMVCAQRVVSHYCPTQEFNHEDVFCCIHVIQMCVDHGNLREFLSWMALFIVDNARQDLSRFNGNFRIFSPSPFWVGWGRCGDWFLWARWRMRFDCNGLHRC